MDVRLASGVGTQLRVHLGRLDLIAEPVQRLHRDELSAQIIDLDGRDGDKRRPRVRMRRGERGDRHVPT